MRVLLRQLDIEPISCHSTAEVCLDACHLHSPSNLTVDQALEDIAMDWQSEVIPGTTLADYGTNLDGFSRTQLRIYSLIFVAMLSNCSITIRTDQHVDISDTT